MNFFYVISILIIFYGCEQKNNDFEVKYDNKGNQFIQIHEDLDDEIIIINFRDTVCNQDTSIIYFYLKTKDFSFVKLYDFLDIQSKDFLNVDTVNKKLFNIEESHVFKKDTLRIIFFSGSNKNVKSSLSKGPALCFLIKDKTNGVFHLVKKQEKTVIVNCDSLEKIKYFTPNVVFSQK